MKFNFKKNLTLLIIAVVVFAILYSLISTKILSSYASKLILLAGINIILALSLNLIIGFTGQLALGHAGFMCVGAYTGAIFTVKFHMPFIIAILAGGLAAAIAGYLIGLPTLRLKGDYLAITTLAFGEIIRDLINNIDYVGGSRGFAGIPAKATFPWIFAIVVLTIVLVYNIIKSSQGRAMIAVREDEIAAESMGVNSTKYKLIAFVIGAFLAGVAGVLFAHYLRFIQPNSFNFMQSVNIVMFVVLGGMGSITGSILSAGVLTFLPELLRSFENYRMVIYSLMLILIMLFRPQGLMGRKELSSRVFKLPFKSAKGGE